MDLKQAQVLITGGSGGIGLGLAIRFMAAGSRVLVTGRNAAKLEKAAQDNPGLLTYVNDIGNPLQREQLAEHMSMVMPKLNVLINNAGFQRRLALAEDIAPWADRQAEIDVLLSGPIHLNHLLIPLILSQTQPGLIVNVTSGGAYIPQVFAPVYSACKAALHSYTTTLRHALANTHCRVAELIPPAVQTGLAGPGLNHGAPLNEFCDAVFAKLIQEDINVGFGPSAAIVDDPSAQKLNAMFAASVTRFPVTVY
jgi:uncharacterized oxidoreductase